jgi:ATP-binding cassette, subfamily C, bacterial CydD
MMLHSRLFELTKDVRSRIVVKALIGLLITGSYAAQAVLTARAMNSIFAGSSWRSIAVVITGVAAVIAARAGLLWANETYAKKTSVIVKNTLRQRLYSHLLKLGPGFLEKNRTGKLQSTVVSGIEFLEAYLIYYVPHVFVTIVGTTFILCYIFSLSVTIGFIILSAFLISLFGPRVWNKLMAKYGRSHWHAFQVLNAQFLDSMQGITTLKSFNASGRIGRELEKDSRELFRQTMNNLRISLLKTGIVGLSTTSGSVFTVGLGALFAAQGKLPLNQLFILLFLCREAFRPIDELNRYYHQGFMGITASNSIFALLDEKLEVIETDIAAAQKAENKLPEIRFKNVEFAYDEGLRPALRGVSFSIKPGETVALVGESGAGKSTVINLLLRFFEPLRGEIVIGKYNIKEYSLETLRSMMAVVSQETYLFHGTVEANLRMAKPGASREELEEATKTANIHDFILGLSEGYDTIVGERGVRFSGGERQRMAIARALLKDAPILLLDEATSSVDTENERLIQKGLEKMMKNRTTLVIAHRLSTIQNADRILVLKEGKIVEAGTHPELLKSSGVYANLIKAQQEREERCVRYAYCKI